MDSTRRADSEPRAVHPGVRGAPGQGYTGRPRACGGIGRRARLRALWTDWSVEVRVLSGALGKAPLDGAFSYSGSSHCFRPVVDVLLSRGKYVHSVRPSGGRDNGLDVRVSASFHRGAWEVRWRDASGRRRARRFATEDAARAFDEALAEVSPAARRADTARHGRSGGVYSYRTAEAVRWRFVYRRSDGTQTTKRGFASERAARDARRRLIEQVERGEVRHTKETFGGYWGRWLDRRRPYLEPGTWSAMSARAKAAAADARRALARRALGRRHPRVRRRAGRGGRGRRAGSEDGQQHARDTRGLPQRGGRGRTARSQPGAAGAAAPARPHRARLPAPRRDPSIPRRVLGRLQAARRAADRERPADLRGTGALRRRSGA